MIFSATLIAAAIMAPQPKDTHILKSDITTQYFNPTAVFSPVETKAWKAAMATLRGEYATDSVTFCRLVRALITIEHGEYVGAGDITIIDADDQIVCAKPAVVKP